MARYGFSGDKTEMKIFILYVMRHVLDPVTLDQMGEIVLIDDNMNYFQYCECAAELVNSELLIKEADGEGRETYTLTPRGYDTVSAVESSLPTALRRAARENALIVLNRLRRESRLEARVIERKGEPLSKLTMTDGRDPILQIEIMAGDREQAGEICRNFLHRAEDVFDGILRALLDEVKEKNDEGD